MLENLVSIYFFKCIQPFLCSDISITVFQVYGIIIFTFLKQFTYCVDKTFISCISSGPMLLMRSNLDSNSFVFS